MTTAFDELPVVVQRYLRTRDEDDAPTFVLAEDGERLRWYCKKVGGVWTGERGDAVDQADDLTDEQIAERAEQDSALDDILDRASKGYEVSEKSLGRNPDAKAERPRFGPNSILTLDPADVLNYSIETDMGFSSMPLASGEMIQAQTRPRTSIIKLEVTNAAYNSKAMAKACLHDGLIEFTKRMNPRVGGSVHVVFRPTGGQSHGGGGWTELQGDVVSQKWTP